MSRRVGEAVSLTAVARPDQMHRHTSYPHMQTSHINSVGFGMSSLGCGGRKSALMMGGWGSAVQAINVLCLVNSSCQT